LIVPVFPSRILSVSYGQHFVCVAVIGPLNATDFVLPHGGRNRKPNDASERNFLSGVCVACRDKSIELILCRTSVTFVTFSNKAKTRERYASETDAIRRYDDGLDRLFRIFNALRGRVCRICTRLFAFSFAFVPVRDRACTR